MSRRQNRKRIGHAWAAIRSFQSANHLLLISIHSLFSQSVCAYRSAGASASLLHALHLTSSAGAYSATFVANTTRNAAHCSLRFSTKAYDKISYLREIRIWEVHLFQPWLIENTVDLGSEDRKVGAQNGCKEIPERCHQSLWLPITCSVNGILPI